MKNRKKTLKVSLLVASVVCGTLAFLTPYQEAKAVVASKYANMVSCADKSGTVVAYGNVCTAGGTSCISNPCPGGTW